MHGFLFPRRFDHFLQGQHLVETHDRVRIYHTREKLAMKENEMAGGANVATEKCKVP